MSIGSRVKKARRDAKLTKAGLAEAVGIKQSTISELERGLSRSTTFLALIAKACNVSTEWLEGISDNPHPKSAGTSGMERVDITRYVPEIDMVQAGEWTEVGLQQNLEDAIHWPCPVKCGPDTFALRVKGPSMLPDFPPGSIIFVDPGVRPESGKKVVACLEDENSATFKQYFEDSGRKYLKAMNPEWPSQYTEINGNCRVIGTVIFAGKET